MKYIAYYRVSSQKQGKSGLGLEAQKKMVADFIAANNGELVGEYTEVESGKVDSRPELAKAMRQADLVKGQLLVAKLDRLSRSLHFLTSLQKNQVNFVIADMPHCDSFTVHIYGALAQKERERISSTTKAGLERARARGVKLGTNNLKPELVAEASAKGVQVLKAQAADFANKVMPTITALKDQGKGLREIARELDKIGVLTARGKQWTPTAVNNVLKRAAA
ncbi:recombinase family protein [Geobacter pelophilus]|uniref:Recombinase family protein n=1 Tax=Geoanaerobacter pelophilus TaxID=60036 RepID=A0AAW4LB03_9BACT|nr:recombinase family protein [Geoanaerobacter pelophilus]MBT0666278.1 recombinase family protein [Geoanaerobacter pelophilus]